MTNIDDTYTSMQEIERLWLAIDHTAEGLDESGNGFTTHHRICQCGKALGECFEFYGGLSLWEGERELYMRPHEGTDTDGFPVLAFDDYAPYDIIEPYEPRLSMVWDDLWNRAIAHHRVAGSLDEMDAIFDQGGRDELALARWNSNDEVGDRTDEAWDRYVDSWDWDGGDRWTSTEEDEDAWEPLPSFLWYQEEMSLVGLTDFEEDFAYHNPDAAF